jgi:alpha-beta hydrolase superfamily lysophospholipase
MARNAMNAQANIDSCRTSRCGTARALYFESGDNHLFAWLHQPSTPSQQKLGIVICSPFGYESICAHRSVREFAETIADSGIPALRFDYSGSGDSADIDEDCDVVKRWTQDVISAIQELRHRTGVDRICLLGIRLGAMLAALAAAECRMVESLILIGPVVSGRRYVRELRMTQLAGIAMSGSPGSDADPEANRTNPKTLEAGGFSLSAATLQSLALVDLQAAAVPPVRSILIFDNDKLPSAKRWAESLSQSGIALEYKTLPGLIEMAMTAPQYATVPRAMIDATQQWLTAVAPSTEAEPTIDRLPAGRGTPVDESSTVAALSLVEDPELPQASITERPVFISAGVALFGIVTEPRSDEKRRRAVILLNPGADFHIGASRMYVSLARRWARRGYFVLRLDLAGIGDSATRSGNVDDEVFPDEAIDDIRVAIEFIRSRYAIVDTTLVGLCSGAYHALRAAADGVSVNRILMVNPQNYFWKKGMTLGQIQLAEVVHNPGLYRQRMVSVRAWLRIFTGQVNVMRIAAIYLQRLRLAGESILRDLARRLHIRLPRDLGWELEKIVADGIRVTFVFARGEPGIALLKLQAGSTVSRLGDRCHVRIVDSGDHIFSRREPRSIMENVLSEELFACADAAAGTTEPRPSHPLRQASAKLP